MGQADNKTTPYYLQGGKIKMADSTHNQNQRKKSSTYPNRQTTGDLLCQA